MKQSVLTLIKVKITPCITYYRCVLHKLRHTLCYGVIRVLENPPSIKMLFRDRPGPGPGPAPGVWGSSLTWLGDRSVRATPMTACRLLVTMNTDLAFCRD